uniref:Uncharacterized protein n=1 Tax=Caenorhabditis japonica TaxID=281687 RepID=A0A8R1IZS2_CAEJA
MSPRRGNNILDIYLSNTRLVQDVDVADLFSDHNYINITLNIRKCRIRRTEEIKLYKKADYLSMYKLLSHRSNIRTAFIYKIPRIASKYQGLINPRRLQFSQHGSQVLPFANEHQTVLFSRKLDLT